MPSNRYVCTNRYTSIKEYYKIIKYKDPKAIWDFKTTTIPFIVGAIGMIKKGTDKHINLTLVSLNQNETAL